MPKSKKPPVKAAEGKPAAAKPGVSGKAPSAPASLGKSVGKPAGKAVVSAGPMISTVKGVSTVKGLSTAKTGKVVSAGKPAAKSAAPAMKAVLGKNGERKVAKAVGTKSAKIVEPPRPAEPRKWPKGGPTKTELKHYRDRLLEMRRALLSSSKELAAEALKSSGQDFSVDHMADNGSDNYEQDFSLKLLEGESEQLADIREALMKIDGKVETPFGICEACADEDQHLCETCPWIPPSRLEVLPHARLCVQTKEIEERRKS